MATTQSEDPNERVHHPRHYNAHPSGIETIELIEHLPTNLGNAVKYIWRCGLKSTETPLRDLKSAKWYTEREDRRIALYELEDAPKPKTEVVWRSFARQVIASGIGDDDGNPELLALYLESLLELDFTNMIEMLDEAIAEMEMAK